MNVVDLRVYSDPAFTPVVILVDPQREYLSERRALGLPNVSAAVENCRALLGFARQQGFPVAFMRWRQAGKFFDRSGAHGAWIEGLEPTGSDMIFDRAAPSCYANPDFAAMMDGGGGTNAVLAGFTGTIACLSTIIDGYHRQHAVTFLADASSSHDLQSSSHDAAHRFISEVISLYCPVTSTSRWICEQTQARRPRIGAAND